MFASKFEVEASFETIIFVKVAFEIVAPLPPVILNPPVSVKFTNCVAVPVVSNCESCELTEFMLPYCEEFR